MVSPRFYEDTKGNVLMEICKPLPLLYAVTSAAQLNCLGLPPSLAVRADSFSCWQRDTKAQTGSMALAMDT